ncbi:hypothetical protein FHY73_23965 [Bacillus tropicus]|uniref:hypothetical protein n=1 Tax=Bacillus tropicus TaxID=2026188 RepID=UPI00111E1553|nr:hypothetical protein [Bacillus tropicus]TNP14080.1 hypothetical protein FHY73_23965 [Bacillus tropicus]
MVKIETDSTVQPKKIRIGFVIFIVLTIILIVIALLIGKKIGFNNATIDLSDKKVTVEQIEKEIDKRQEEIKEKKEEQKQKKEELESVRSEYQEVKSLVNKKDEISKNIEGLQATVEQKKQESSSFDTQINDKKRELEMLTKGVIEKKQEPRIMVAGTFTVGKDIPAGRYKIEPNKGSGNYFVNGGSKTNIILGNGYDNFLQEYVITLNEGDQIETNVSVKYTAVE